MAIVDQLKSLYLKMGGDTDASAYNISEWLRNIYLELGGDPNSGASNIEDWIDKIEDVWSGGGSGGDETEKADFIDYIENSFTELVNAKASKTYDGYLSYNPDIQKVEMTNCATIGNMAFCSCDSLTTVSFPVCASIGSSAFQYCTSLTSVNFPACTSIGDGAFDYCVSLTSISFPVCTSR